MADILICCEKCDHEAYYDIDVNEFYQQMRHFEEDKMREKLGKGKENEDVTELENLLEETKCKLDTVDKIERLKKFLTELKNNY